MVPAPRVPAMEDGRLGVPQKDESCRPRHRSAHQPAERAEHARLRASWSRAFWRRAFEETAQAGGAARKDGEELPRPGEGGSVHQGNVAANGFVVGEKTGGNVVGAVEKDVRPVQQLVGGVAIESDDARFGADAPGGDDRLGL